MTLKMNLKVKIKNVVQVCLNYHPRPLNTKFHQDWGYYWWRAHRVLGYDLTYKTEIKSQPPKIVFLRSDCRYRLEAFETTIFDSVILEYGVC